MKLKQLSDLDVLKDAKCGASLEGGFLYLEDGETFPIAAMVDLITSVDDTDDTSDEGESYVVMGNVDTPTLVALGFRDGPTPGPFDSPSQKALRELAERLKGDGIDAGYEYPGFVRIDLKSTAVINIGVVPVDLQSAAVINIGDSNGYYSADLTEIVDQNDQALAFKLPLAITPELLYVAVKELIELVKQGKAGEED